MGRTYGENHAGSDSSEIAGDGDVEQGLNSSQDNATRVQPALVLSNSGKALEQTGKKQYVKQVTGRYNDTDLHLAAKKGDLEAVKKLLDGSHSENGVQNHQVDIDMGEIRSSLVDEQNELAETPLYIAAEQGHLEVLKELLKFAHPETLAKKNHTGYDVFHIAAKQGHISKILWSQPFQKVFTSFAVPTRENMAS